MKARTSTRSSYEGTPDKVAVQSTMTHGCEGWYFDETAQKTLNGTNAWMNAVLTGRSAHDVEAGYILKMNEDRLVQRALLAD